jgi:hypothetical protein
MAGNCNLACVEGHFSLVKERIRIAPKRQQLVPIPQLNALSLSQGRRAKRKRLRQFDFTRPSTRSSQTPTSCGWLGSKALQIVCFSLVTLKRLLY